MAPRKEKVDDIERLERTDLKQKKVIENILRIKKSFHDKTISTTPAELECRLEIINAYILQAMTLQDELESLDPSLDTRADLENICVSTKALFKAPLSKTQRSSTMDMSMFASSSHHSQLPKLTLPQFSGKHSEFKNFYSLFLNLVHNDTSLSPIEKFNHLISCLSGDALGTVKAFQVTEENYEKALTSLRNVYDNKCLIFFDSISQLFELPVMSKPSASGLRSAIDTITAIYESLLSVGDDKSISHAFLIHLVMSKIDAESRMKFEEQLDYNKLPSWSDCEKVLNKRYQQMSAEEASQSNQRNASVSKIFRSKESKSKSTHFVSKQDTASNACLHCNGSGHFISSCSSFIALAVKDRIEFARKQKLCINCLRKGHTVSGCKSSKCKVCAKPHNTMLHIYKTASTSAPVSQPNRYYPETQSQYNTANVNIASCQEDKVILATALIKIKDATGQFQTVRALLDSGSQINFVSEELVQRLRLKKERSSLNIVTVDSTTSTAKHSVHAFCKSTINDYTFDSNFHVLHNISSSHSDMNLPYKTWNIPANIQLADPYFYKPQKVELLIGAELFFELLCVGQIKFSPNLPIFQKTLLGWIVSGKFSQSATCLCTTLQPTSLKSPHSIDALLQKFWTLEEISPHSKPVLTIEQKDCEDHFTRTVRQMETGRIQVSLPFKGNASQLGLSFNTAQRRFLALERKLIKNSELREMYNSFMREYLSLGHMSLATHDVQEGSHYFIPHQCVLRPESTTTKLRVVFDASSKTSSGVSLNDILMVGAFIQDDLFTTLIRFRLNMYAITADITKMYRQVLVDEADRKFQLIVWRESESDPIRVYQLNTVTYGTASAPFLATRSLTYLGDKFESEHPIGAQILKRNFYVDDMLAGAQTIEELYEIRTQVSKILSSAGFSLAKWFSNHPSFFVSDSEEKSLSVNDAESTKALGIKWFPKNDNFTFRLDPNFESLKPTKRYILSVSSRLFDPLGLLWPLITKAKILLQELWLKRLDWDETIPQHLATSWSKFITNLSQLSSLSVPRFVNTTREASISIHGFADASVRAYGCCIYVRCQTSESVSVKLLTAKSKVAPLKTKTLPRLELCAAHLLTKLWVKIKPLLTESFSISQCVFWSDSEIVLHWIQNHSSAMSVFVANRVAEIQEQSVDVLWRHIPTQHNPADIVSRGCYVEDLINSIWFTGPQFLVKSPQEWPINKHFKLTSDQKLLEVKKSKAIYIATKTRFDFIEIIDYHSSFPKIINIFCYIYRITHTELFRKSFTAQEKNLAFLKIVEIIQKHNFSAEISKIKGNQPVKPHLQKLNPFIQELTVQNRSFSLLRVGGRLSNAPQLHYDTKFPLLLPKNSNFVLVYLRHLHIQHCHAGPKTLLSLLRQKVWLVNAREACSRVVRRCVHCFHYKPKLSSQIMGNLPVDRLRQIRPFAISGVDFFGPVYVSLRIRGRPPIKMYVAVFVCFASKAVHLELVDNLTTDCFLSVLSRFIGRRGIPQTIYCDNATNFVGAKNELKDLAETFEEQREKMELFTSERGIDFKFIPPRAPHFGGLWEAAVKQAKHHLIKNIGNAKLTTIEVMTILVEVEAILNSRPIAAMSNDPNDTSALTAGHLLIREAIVSLPHASAPDVPDCKLRCLKRFQLLSALKQRFWRAWLKDYVLDIQSRNKWQIEQPNLTVGTLVMVHEDNVPPQRWIVGRVTTVVTGNDGKVRSAEVKTKSGFLRRSINKLAALPVVET